MSTFDVKIVPIKLEEHPNADLLELAVVGDYRCVVGKGLHKDGDLVAYIPEQAIIPDWLIKKMNLEGKLSGSAKNRVKAVKLRGALSQGLCYPAHYGLLSVENGSDVLVREGDDVKDVLGIVKYEPTIPASFAGKAVGVDFKITIPYDFENIKKHPTLFDDGEEVVMNEKLHGTFCEIGIVPLKDGNDRLWNGVGVVTSKGLGGKGIILDHTDLTSVYVKIAVEGGVFQKMFNRFHEDVEATGEPVYIFGEIFGGGIQDLEYGMKHAEFRVFDMCRGFRNMNTFYSYPTLQRFANDLDLPMVPELYRGPFSKEVMMQHTVGVTTVNAAHMREGIVIKAVSGMDHPRFGRKIAKSINEAYLLRKNGTEFN